MSKKAQTTDKDKGKAKEAPASQEETKANEAKEAELKAKAEEEVRAKAEQDAKELAEIEAKVKAKNEARELEEAKKAEEAKESKSVTFLSTKATQLAIWIKQREYFKRDGLGIQDPGLCVQFDMGKLVINPSVVYYKFEKHELTGDRIIAVIRSLDGFGTSIVEEIRSDDERSLPLSERLEKYQLMSHDQVNVEALSLGVIPEGKTREKLILEILSKI